MSGIAGIIHFDGAPIEPGLVEKMTTALAHRGPDGIRHWVKGSVALGQCMLNTTPESLEETQPLTNEDESLILVMDGRVDNWEELRRDLLAHGATLRNRSDAELVLRSYQQWGRDCLQHIDGDFALVIWDALRREAFCARDRMGNKPFNYHWNGRTLVFASELHAILAMPWVAQRPNEGVIAEYLAAEWHSRDETLWTGIVRLVAAHQMTVASNGPHPEIYWEPDLGQTLPYTRDQDYIDHYRELFADSVRRLSRSHRPVAIEVSGGLDSSAIFCMAEHLRGTGRLPVSAIAGYTLAFNNEGATNDLPYARAVGEYLGVRIHEIAPASMPLDWYAHRARITRNFPGFPNGVMSASMIQRAQADGSRVLLHGIGGDEWQEGSRSYYVDELFRGNWRALLQCCRADAKAFGVLAPIAWLSRQILAAILPDSLKTFLRSVEQRLREGSDTDICWLSPQMQRQVRRRRQLTSQQLPQGTSSRGQRRMLGVLLHYAYRDLALEEIERERAIHGIEPRSPLNTAGIVQCALATPERMRMRGGQTKFMHRRATQDLMPRDVLNRQDKAEFSTVFDFHLRQMEKLFTIDLPETRPEWVTHQGMRQIFQAHQENQMSSQPVIWALWSLFGCDKVMP